MLYKVEYDAAEDTVKFVDSISVDPSPYVYLTDGHIDISEHNFVIMSAAQCDAAEGDEITNLSAYIYNFD